MFKKLLAAIAVLTLLTGFVAACGGDDDDDDSATAQTDDTSSTEQPAPDDGGAVSAKADFCADFNESDTGDTTADDVIHSADLADAAAAEAPDDVAPSLQTLADFARDLGENDDDGKITQDEAGAAADAAGIGDALAAASQYCSAE